MKPGQDKRYTYATGRIRVLETRLLNRQTLERFIEAETINEAIFILKEYRLSQDLDENLMAAYKILDELSLDKELTDIFRLRYDFQAFRERFGLQLSSITIDKLMVDYTYKVLRRYDFLRNYFKRYIDLKNLNFYFRLKEKKEVLKEALLDNGYIKRDLFLRELDMREVRQYEQLINHGLEYAKRDGDFGFFEKLCDDYLLNLLKPAKYFPFGIEPLFGYVVAVEQQARSINTILFSKKNEIPKETIRQTLRESYV